MAYARIESGVVVEYPVYEGNIRQRFLDPLVIFGQGEYFVPPDGYEAVADVDPPAINPATQDLAEGEPELVDGQWRRTWTVTASSPETVAERAAVRRATMPPVSDRQFFQQLALMGHITEAEALDAVGPGILPASMLALIEMLPEEHRFSTRIILTGATSFERGHPLTAVLGGMFGMDDLALDELWQAARQL